MMKVLAGDWPEGANVTFKTSGLSQQSRSLLFQKGTFSFEEVSFGSIETLEVVTEDKRMSVGGKLGWGVAGGLLLGPIGAVIGGIAGGNKNEKVLALTFHDGRKVLLKAKAKDAEKLMSAAYRWE